MPGKKAITTEPLTDDMELELLELFPRHGDLRLEAIRLLIHLEESGPQKQSELAEQLGMEPYAAKPSTRVYSFPLTFPL